MSSGEAEETQRVSTYVPTNQKATWDQHAEELGMSRSEFVRTMVQAGRRQFTHAPAETADRDANPRDRGLEDTVRQVLRDEGPLDWDELVDELTASVESDLDRVLNDLQSENAVRHSGSRGGYTLMEPDDE